jgi:pilus assembly protein Flp/PilA
MPKFQSFIRVLRDIRGTSSVEYAMILGVIVLVIMATLQGVATQTTGMWNNVSTKSANAIGGS